MSDTLFLWLLGLLHKRTEPEHENHRYTHELDSLGLIRIQPRMNRAIDEKNREFRLINITKEGLQELSMDQELR
jgi:hypothetical protein